MQTSEGCPNVTVYPLFGEDDSKNWKKRDPQVAQQQHRESILNMGQQD